MPSSASEQLACRRESVLIAVKTLLAERGYGPSIPEIAARTNLAISTVHSHIRALCDEGILAQTPRRSRTIRLARGKRLRKATVVPLNDEAKANGLRFDGDTT